VKSKNKGRFSMWQPAWMWSKFQLARMKNLSLTPSLLRFYQERRVNQLLKNVTKDIRYYQEYASLSLPYFPILDKMALQENFAAMNAFQYSKELVHPFLGKTHSHFHVNQSMGTAGTSSLFLFSKQEIARILFHVLSKILNPSFEKPKVAIFHLTPAPYFPQQLSLTWMNTLFIDLNQPEHTWRSTLQAFQPEIVIAPVQTLCRLSHLQLEKKMNLHPQKIISTAEILTAAEEKLITTTFAQNILQLYQCAEGWLGLSCEFGTLHLFEDAYLIEKEWVDETNNRFVPVVTALNRRVQPLVRYRMEDILVEKQKPCACQSPMLGVERIVGRCEDILYFSTMSRQHTLKPIYSDILRQAVTMCAGGIQKFQIIQYSANHLHIKIQAENIALAKVCIQQQLEKLWNSQLIKHPVLEFSQLDSPSLNQMFRQTTRLVKATPN
jgi:putative adenylate-forming enzyme